MHSHANSIENLRILFCEKKSFDYHLPLPIEIDVHVHD